MPNVTFFDSLFLHATKQNLHKPLNNKQLKANKKMRLFRLKTGAFYCLQVEKQPKSKGIWCNTRNFTHEKPTQVFWYGKSSSG
jgi:hypothetical protein